MISQIKRSYQNWLVGNFGCKIEVQNIISYNYNSLGYDLLPIDIKTRKEINTIKFIVNQRIVNELDFYD